MRLAEHIDEYHRERLAKLIGVHDPLDLPDELVREFCRWKYLVDRQGGELHVSAENMATIIRAAGIETPLPPKFSEGEAAEDVTVKAPRKPRKSGNFLRTGNEPVES